MNWKTERSEHAEGESPCVCGNWQWGGEKFVVSLVSKICRDVMKSFSIILFGDNMKKRRWYIDNFQNMSYDDA